MRHQEVYRELSTFLPENVFVPEEIIFEIISETAFLRGGWEELIQKRGSHWPMGPMGPMGSSGSSGSMGPIGPMGPLGPLGSMGPMCPMGPWAQWAPWAPWVPWAQGPFRINSETSF